MTTILLSIPYAAALGVCVLLYFVVYPVVVYFRDVNGERYAIQKKERRLMTQASEDIQTCTLFRASHRFLS
jgi:hypothetical protein